MAKNTMENQYIVDLMKLFFIENKVKLNSIYLFGSRGRGDYQDDSDFDFLIVLEDNLANQERRKLSSGIRNFLFLHKIFLNMDIIIKNHENWEWESQNLGFLSYTVKNEGILL